MRRSLWMKLFIDPNRDINIVTIKRNRKVFIINNLVLALQYLLFLTLLIYILVINGSSLNIADKRIHYYAILISTAVLFISSQFNNAPSITFVGGVSSYQIYGKYVTEKFKYFYNYQIKFEKSSTYTECYLKEKKVNDQDINPQLRNHGLIMNMYVKNNKKAIRFVKASLVCFYLVAFFYSAFVLVVTLLVIIFLFL